jgi:hypothetical protein
MVMQFVRFIGSLIVSAVILVLTFIPLWAFLAAKAALNPEGFWQKFAVGVGGIALLGGLQIFFLFVGVLALIAYWKYVAYWKYR